MWVCEKGWGNVTRVGVCNNSRGHVAGVEVGKCVRGAGQW